MGERSRPVAKARNICETPLSNQLQIDAASLDHLGSPRKPESIGSYDQALAIMGNTIPSKQFPQKTQYVLAELIGGSSN